MYVAFATATTFLVLRLLLSYESVCPATFLVLQLPSLCDSIFPTTFFFSSDPLSPPTFFSSDLSSPLEGLKWPGDSDELVETMMKILKGNTGPAILIWPLFVHGSIVCRCA